MEMKSSRPSLRRLRITELIFYFGLGFFGIALIAGQFNLGEMLVALGIGVVIGLAFNGVERWVWAEARKPAFDLLRARGEALPGRVYGEWDQDI